MEGVLRELTGVLAIIMPVAIVLIIFGFRHLRFIQRQQTIRIALEKGLDPSSLLAEEELQPLQQAQAADPRRYALRGLLWGLPGIVIGIGVTWVAFQRGARDVTIIGWIPAAIGAAYLIYYRWVTVQERDSAKTGGPFPPGTQPSRTRSAQTGGTE